MASNIRLLRASLCANDWIRDRVALYGTGLGTKWVILAPVRLPCAAWRSGAPCLRYGGHPPCGRARRRPRWLPAASGRRSCPLHSRLYALHQRPRSSWPTAARAHGHPGALGV
jgi:hypothetical protein